MVIMLHAETLVFRFHVQNDPDSLDPSTSRSSISSYVLNALYVPLLTYQEGKLGAGGAKECKKINSIHYRCEIRKDWHWSDGMPVVATQIVDGFKAMQDEKSARLSHFSNIKNVRAQSSSQLDFFLHKADSDFIYKLVDPALGPRRKDVSLKFGAITYGAYTVSKRIPGRSLYLVPNPKFYTQNSRRPDIEVLIVDSDSTALRLFESKKLNFLRRLSTENIPDYKNSQKFMQRSLHRIDYIGFGPELLHLPDLRERLIHSLDPQFQKFIDIFGALGRPGCFGLEKSIVQKNPCFETKVVSPYLNAEIKSLPKLTLHYAQLGGDDIGRAMEFFQAGWKKNLNLEVELHPTEYSALTQKLKDSPPPLFRRGVQLESPTCLAALEIFESVNPENYLKINDKDLDSIILKLRSHNNPNDKKLCVLGLSAILKTRRIIPLGAIHFTMLTDLNFTGFLINELNQLDVSRLSPKAK